MNLNSGRKSLSISLIHARFAIKLSLKARSSISSAFTPGFVSSSYKQKILQASSFELSFYKSFNEKAVCTFSLLSELFFDTSDEVPLLDFFFFSPPDLLRSHK